MSLTLEIDSKSPYYCRIGLNGDVQIENLEIGIKDFLVLAQYVLTNTDLTSDDPRKQFVECVRRMRETEGWNGPQSVHYESDVPAIS